MSHLTSSLQLRIHSFWKSLTGRDLSEMIPWAVGLLLCSALAVAVLRSLLTTPGLWQFNDSNLNYNPEVNRDFSYSVWNPFISYDNGRTLPALIWTSWLYQLGPDAAQRLGLFLDITVPAFIFYVVGYLLASEHVAGRLPRYLAALSATVVGVVNPFVTMRVDNANYIFNLGVMAAAFYLSNRAIEATSTRKVLPSAAILGVLAAFDTILPHTLVESFAVALVSVVIGAGLSSDRFTRLKRGVVFLIVSGALTVALLAYWILPFGAGLFSRYGSSPNLAAFETVLSPVNPIYRSGGLVNAVGATTSWWTPIYFANDGAWQLVWTTAVLTIPVISFSALALRRHDSKLITAAVIAIFGIVFASGPRGPFGTLYLAVSRAGPLVATLMYDQDAFTMFTVFGYAILSSAAVSELAQWLWTRKSQSPAESRKPAPHMPRLIRFLPTNKSLTTFRVIAAVGIGWLFVASAVGAYPLVSGDLAGRLQPTLLPASYNSMNAWLATHAPAERTVWFPDSLPNILLPNSWAVNWLPDSEVASYPADYMLYAPGQRILYPTGGSLDRPMYSFILSTVVGNQTRVLGKLLETTNTRVVVYHADTVPPAESLLRNLSNQTDLVLAQQYGPLTAFENTEPVGLVSGVNRTMIVIGGLGALNALNNLAAFQPSAYAMLFPEEGNMNLSSLENLLDFNSTLVFYGNKGFSDLTMDLIGSQYYVSPLEAFSTDDSFTWTPGTVMDWNGLPPYVQYYPYSYDFDLNEGFVTSNQPSARYSVPIQVSASASYEIWVRIMIQPAGGAMSFTLSGTNATSTVNTTSTDPTKGGFRWIHLFDASLGAGSHSLTFENLHGTQVVNAFAVAPAKVVSDVASRIVQTFDQHKVRVVVLPYTGTFPKAHDVGVFSSDFLAMAPWTPTGNWTLQSGVATSGPGTAPTLMLPANATPEANLNISVRARLLSNSSQASILFFVGDGAGYSFELRGWSDSITVSKTVNGSAISNYAARSFPLQANQWYNVDLVAGPSGVRCFVDGALVLQYGFLPARGTGVGLGAYANAVQFSNFTVGTPHIAISTPWPTERTYIAVGVNSTGASAQYSVPLSTDPTLTVTTNVEIGNASQMIVYSASGSGVTSLDQAFKATPAVQLTSVRGTQTADIHAQGTCSGPFIALLMEGYSPFWEASLGDSILAHYPVYAAMNAFAVPSCASSFSISFTFSLEKAFQVGVGITIITALGFVTVPITALVCQMRTTRRQRQKGQEGGL